MRYYSKIAEGYNGLYQEEQISKIKLIKSNTELTGLILDIGSGTGFSRFYFKNLIQIDPCFEMLKQSEGCLFLNKAEKLPFRENTFDSVISITSLHHADIKKAVKEIKRVSKPNCKFAFSILRKSKNFEKIRKELHDNFNLKEIEHEKDLIFVGELPRIR